MARNNRRTFLKTVSGVLGTSSVYSGIATSQETNNDRQTKPSELTSNQPQIRHKGSKNKSKTSGPSPYPKLSWEMDLDGSMAAVEPVIANETLFLAVTTQNGPTSGKGYVAAYDPETGAELWKQTGLPAPRTPILNDGTLYFSTFVWEDFTEGGLFAIDADTGELLWRRVEYFVWADPILADGQLYTESSGGVYALAPTTGEINWKREDVTGQIGYADWRIHDSDGSIYLGDGTALNVEDGSVEWHITDEDFTLRQTGDKLVYGIRKHSDSQLIEARLKRDGTVKWTAKTHVNDERGIQLTVTDKMVVSTETTDENSIITAYKKNSGKQIWQHTSTLPVAGNLVVANKRILFRSGNYRARRIAALDTKTGKLAWEHNDPTLLFYNGPVVADGTAYFGGQYKPGSNFVPRWALVYAVDVKTGEREWSYLMKDLDDQSKYEPPAAGTPVVVDGRLYTATFPGTSTIDWEYVRYANLVVFESADQPPDADHRLPDEIDAEGKPPEACIETSPDPEQNDLEPGNYVTLDASCSSDSDGSNLQYEWTVDDKFEGDNSRIGVEVPGCGEKEVRLTVTDSDGDTDTAGVVITAS